MIPSLLEGGLLARRSLLSGVRQTPWGRIAVIILPVFKSGLYRNRSNWCDTPSRASSTPGR